MRPILDRKDERHATVQACPRAPQDAFAGRRHRLGPGLAHPARVIDQDAGSAGTTDDLGHDPRRGLGIGAVGFDALEADIRPAV